MRKSDFTEIDVDIKFSAPFDLKNLCDEDKAVVAANMIFQVGTQLNVPERYILSELCSVIGAGVASFMYDVESELDTRKSKLYGQCIERIKKATDMTLEFQTKRDLRNKEMSGEH